MALQQTGPIEVRPDPDVVPTHQVDHMLNVVDDILVGRVRNAVLGEELDARIVLLLEVSVVPGFELLHEIAQKRLYLLQESGIGVGIPLVDQPG